MKYCLQRIDDNSNDIVWKIDNRNYSFGSCPIAWRQKSFIITDLKTLRMALIKHRHSYHQCRYKIVLKHLIFD